MRRLAGNRSKRWGLIVLELGLLLAVVWSIYAWQTKGLLATDGLTAAPPFELQDLDGRTWTVQDFKGKPTVLYFFAPWCGVCNASAPQLRWSHWLFGDDVNLVLVGLEYSSAAELAEYRSAHRLENIVLLGNQATASDYRVRGFPTYYVLDETGAIRRRDFGFSTVAGLWLRACLATG